MSKIKIAVSKKGSVPRQHILDLPALTYISVEEHERLLVSDPEGKLTERHVLGTVENAQVTFDNFGHVYVDGQRLGKHVAVTVQNKDFTAEYHEDPLYAGTETRAEREARLAAGICCGNCRYFDPDEGRKWLNEPTHFFQDGSHKCMNTDIMSMVADDHLKKVITDDNIGYCPKRKRITAFEAPCCGDEDLEH